MRISFRNGILAALFLLLGGFLCGQDACASAKVGFEPEEYRLGELPEGKVFNYSLDIINSGDQELKVSPINVSCGCLDIISPKDGLNIAPGQRAGIAFSFDTSGFFGHQVKFLLIDTNDPSARAARVRIEADVKEREEDFLARFQGFSAGAVVAAGLIDGINPCAFTVLVFFITFLAFVGYTRKEMWVLGTVFILSVFATYLLIGVGIFHIFRQTEIYQILARWVYIATGFSALILGTLSAYDAYIFRKTKDPEKVRLKLPGMIKHRIQGIIRETTDIRKGVARRKNIFRFAVSSAVCGFLVTLLESVCTGQLYFPTIAYIWRIPGLRVRALGYLALYNLAFVAPLIAVFICGTLGWTSGDFARLAARNMVKVKVLTAVIFLVLGAALLMIR